MQLDVALGEDFPATVAIRLTSLPSRPLLVRDPKYSVNPVFILHGRSLTCGTHFGATKEPASMSRTPVCASRLISSSLVERDIVVLSFCRPSLGPTSTIRTSSARLLGVVEKVRKELRGLQ